MDKYINNFKNLPFGVKACEIVYIIVIIIYFYISSGKGLYTTFYSFMAVVVTAGFTAIYLLFFKKNYLLASVNLLIAASLFIKLASTI